MSVRGQKSAERYRVWYQKTEDRGAREGKGSLQPPFYLTSSQISPIPVQSPFSWSFCYYPVLSRLFSDLSNPCPVSLFLVVLLLARPASLLLRSLQSLSSLPLSWPFCYYPVLSHLFSDLSNPWPVSLYLGRSATTPSYLVSSQISPIPALPHSIPVVLLLLWPVSFPPISVLSSPSHIVPSRPGPPGFLLFIPIRLIPSTRLRESDLVNFFFFACFLLISSVFRFSLLRPHLPLPRRALHFSTRNKGVGDRSPPQGG